MTWTCEHIEERLADYTDRLLAPADREAFAAHLAGCPRCAALARRVASLTTTLHAMEPLEPPARLVFAILDQTRRKEEAAGWRAWLRWLGPTGQPRFAMGVVTVAVLMVLMPVALGIDFQNFQWTDLKPGNLYEALDRRANLMYARGVKFVNELRVVYEIQNMLQPASQTQGGDATPESAPADKEKESQPGKSNRAREWEPVIPVTLAALTHGLPGRSNR